MHEFLGDLLIGGLTLRHLHGELEREEPQDDSKDWKLAGHLHLPTIQEEMLEVDRPYRLELEDGRAGQVVVSRVAARNNGEVVVDFEPRQARPR